jgi:flagellar hook-associated protein 2
MSTSIGPTYDPPSTAAALAEKYNAPRQQILTAQTSQAAATVKALTSLNSAILAYQSSLLSMTGANKTMLSRTATFSDPTIGTASAGASATAGTYSFFVETLATASQLTYADMPASTAFGGSLSITAGGAPITVNLTAAANTDGDTALSVRELAAAINTAPGNNAQVSAAVVTIGSTIQLVLTAKNTGVANTISLDTTNVGDATLQSKLAAAPASEVVAQDALVWLGAKGNPPPISQATNTFTNVDGVTMTFTRAQAATDSPVTLTVAPNDGGTAANVQSFIDAYNKLKEVVDGLVDAGDPAKGVAAGALAQDSGVRVLQSRLVSLLRQAGSSTLAGYGITADRHGKLILDGGRLARQVASDPRGLDKLIGSSASASGIAGGLDTYLKQWSSSVNGQIKQRKDATTRQQTTLAKSQDALDAQYDRAYQRYLLQFTKLQTMQSQMASNTSLFDALFGDKSK